MAFTDKEKIEFFEKQTFDFNEHCQNLTLMGKRLRRALIQIYEVAINKEYELTADSPAMKRAQRAIEGTKFFKV